MAGTPAPYTTSAGFGVIPALMDDESFVNGVWAGILASRYFAFPTFVIEPEKYTKSGSRADLFVHRIADGHPMLCYEGKVKGGKGAAFDEAIVQAGKYMKDTGAKYGMVGIGREVVFVTPYLSDLYELQIQRGVIRPAKGHHPLDISTDSASIHAILTLIQQQT
ncbi:hypothetical protein FRB96_007968 [Tulasnella sp. 330]|nr:hypothetical protein FRB96_007968 [Tulasnella sp. 330]KAG8883923.1 hypothetical protein FRB97_005597 [Tulasnella sp. 331]KAG8889242.1 hypothetical protein FRB98_005254 [Tulasnella sp. 332]